VRIGRERAQPLGPGGPEALGRPGVDTGVGHRGGRGAHLGQAVGRAREVGALGGEDGIGGGGLGRSGRRHGRRTLLAFRVLRVPSVVRVRQPDRVPIRRLLLLVVAGLLVAGCADQGSPGAPGQPTLEVLPMPEEVPVPPPGAEPVPEELLALPPAPMELHALQDALMARFGNSPDLGTQEISLDRTVFTIRWHGDPPAELRALAESYRDAPFEIRLERTRFRQGDLLAEAGRLLREHNGVVTVTGPRNEGDGVIVGLDPEVVDAPDAETLRSLGIISRFPLFPESTPPVVPASG
jgi:hypothetical protein